MKKRLYLYMVLSLFFGAWATTSCDINELTTFDDSMSFIALETTSNTFVENEGLVGIPVYFTTLSNTSLTVDFSMDTIGYGDKGSVEGVHYTLKNESKTLTFENGMGYDTIWIQLIDNTTYNGDTYFNITLTSNSANIPFGAMKATKVTISDDEHPLAFILGTLSASGISYFNGPTDWVVTTTKDEIDVTKVWFTNFVPGGPPTPPIYGVVNEDKTEIKIPVKQSQGTNATYGEVSLLGYEGEEGDPEIPDGGFITGTIDENGKITILDWYSSTVSAGSFNIMEYGVTMQKK